MRVYKKAFCALHHHIITRILFTPPARIPQLLPVMAFVRRPCAVALLACAAAFLVAAVGAQPADPSGKPLDTNPILTDPDIQRVYMSPGGPLTTVSCYNRSNPAAKEPDCRITARQCPRGCRDLCYVHCPTCKLVCSKNPIDAYPCL
jgi:hypothetical protein